MNSLQNLSNTNLLPSNEGARLRTQGAHVFKYAPRPSPRLPVHCLKAKWYKNSAQYSEPIKALCFFALAFLVLTPEAFGVANTADAGFNQSTANLVGIVNNSLVPITLISGCLAAAALSFMKSSPAPFIIAILTTISFGFAKVWINTTYAICV